MHWVENLSDNQSTGIEKFIDTIAWQLKRTDELQTWSWAGLGEDTQTAQKTEEEGLGTKDKYTG